MNIVSVGAFCFGLVVGWIVYRTLRRRGGQGAISDIATVIGAIGGGTVTLLYKDPEIFGWYSVGLAIGFFAYFIIMIAVDGKDQWTNWMLE